MLAISIPLALAVLVPLVLAGAGAIGTFGHGPWALGYLRLASPDPAR